MFRSLLPRATPRVALRCAGPKAVPSTFVAAPSLASFGRTQRGYASESGTWLLPFAMGPSQTVPALPKKVAPG